jgi:hypothetical protein
MIKERRRPHGATIFCSQMSSFHIQMLTLLLQESTLHTCSAPLKRVTLPQATRLPIRNSMNHFIIPEKGEDTIVTIVSAFALGNGNFEEMIICFWNLFAIDLIWNS